MKLTIAAVMIIGVAVLCAICDMAKMPYLKLPSIMAMLIIILLAVL